MTEQEFNEWLKKNNFNHIKSIKFGNGSGPAHYAASSGNVEALKFIAEHAPETLSVKDYDGQTPAHLAAAYTNIDALKILAKHAPETLSVKDKFGETPIFGTTRDVESFKFLANQVPETLSLKNEDGGTPAHDAALLGNIEILKYLMEERYDIFTIKDDRGNAPVDRAMQMLKVEFNYEKYMPILKLYAENAPQTLNGEIFMFLVKKAPEALPISLFDKSKEHEEILTSIFDSIKNDMRIKYNYTYNESKKYLQECESEINLINQIVDQKTKEYQEKKPLETVLSKLSKGKGE